jgi:hypothetical protein
VTSDARTCAQEATLYNEALPLRKDRHLSKKYKIKLKEISAIKGNIEKRLRHHFFRVASLKENKAYIGRKAGGGELSFGFSGGLKAH